MRTLMMLAKPTPSRILKRRKKDAEGRVKARVRRECVERDGYCKLAGQLVECDGPSEWAHMHSHRRAKTMRMDPEERHDRRYSFMACKRHHNMYDQHKIDIDAGPEQADGFLTARYRAATTEGQQDA